MLGNPINSEQVKLYMKERKEGKTQETSAAKAGISERSGRRIEKNELQPSRKRPRSWRTRTQHVPDITAPGERMEGALWAVARSDVSTGASHWPDGAFRFHEIKRSDNYHPRSAFHASPVSFSYGFQWLVLSPCDPWRKVCRMPFGGWEESLVSTGATACQPPIVI